MNLLNKEIIAISTIEGKKDFNSVIDEYEKIEARKNGQLLVTYISNQMPEGTMLNGVPYRTRTVRINDFCKGFKYLGSYIYRLALDIEPAWYEEFCNYTAEEQKKVTQNHKKGNYIRNYYRSDNSSKQFSLQDNQIYWQAQKIQEYKDLTPEDFDCDENIQVLHLIRECLKYKRYLPLKIIRKLSHYCYEDEHSVFRVFEALDENMQIFNEIYRRIGIHDTCRLLEYVAKEDAFIIIRSLTYGDARAIIWFYRNFWYEIKENDSISYKKMLAFIKFVKYRFAVYSDNPEDTTATTYGKWSSEYDRKHTKDEITALYDMFIEKFNKVPRLYASMLATCECIIHDNNLYYHCYREVYKDFINNFDVKTFQQLLKSYSTETAVRIITFDKRFSNVKLEKGLVSMLMYNYNKKLADWIYKHQNASYELLREVIQNNLTYDLDTDIAGIKKQIKKSEQIVDIIDFQEHYNFELKYFECNIRTNEVWCGKQHAYFVQDEEMIMLGKYTNCCQRMGGAGETAMAYGIIAPNAGFWAVAERDEIIAQGEVWLGKLEGKEVFVFDNIEIRHGQTILKVIDTLRVWCQESPYHDIIMGKGYNDICLYHDFKDVNKKLYQPYCEDVPNPYTDTKAGCVWLKKANKVVF